MAIFLSLAAFFQRNKRRIIIASTVSFSIYYLVNHFVVKRFRDFQNALKQELFVKEQIKRRFIQTQTDCYLTILALLPVLTQPIADHLPTELVTQALKMKKNSAQNLEMSDSLLTADNLMLHSSGGASVLLQKEALADLLLKSKVDLWNDLKIKTLTRTLTLVYSISALLLLTRLQLNILARRSYLELAIAMAGGKVSEKHPHQVDDDYVTEQSYLSLSWWLLNVGWRRISDAVEPIVVHKFRTINAKTELTIKGFSDILLEVHAEFTARHGSELHSFVFPTNYDSLVETLLNTNPQLIDALDATDSSFVHLVNETNALVGNEVFFSVYDKMVLSTLSTLTNSLLLNLDYDNYLLYNAVSANDKIVEISEEAPKKFKLASLLAQLSVQSNILSDNNNVTAAEVGDDYAGDMTGNAYINSLTELDELDEFSASIYSNFE